MPLFAREIIVIYSWDIIYRVVKVKFPTLLFTVSSDLRVSFLKVFRNSSLNSCLYSRLSGNIVSVILRHGYSRHSVCKGELFAKTRPNHFQEMKLAYCKSVIVELKQSRINNNILKRTCKSQSSSQCHQTDLKSFTQLSITNTILLSCFMKIHSLRWTSLI